MISQGKKMITFPENPQITIHLLSFKDRLIHVLGKETYLKLKEAEKPPSRCYECSFYIETEFQKKHPWGEEKEGKACTLNPYDPEYKHPFSKGCSYGYREVDLN